MIIRVILIIPFLLLGKLTFSQKATFYECQQTIKRLSNSKQDNSEKSLIFNSVFRNSEEFGSKLDSLAEIGMEYPNFDSIDISMSQVFYYFFSQSDSQLVEVSFNFVRDENNILKWEETKAKIVSLEGGFETRPKRFFDIQMISSNFDKFVTDSLNKINSNYALLEDGEITNKFLVKEIQGKGKFIPIRPLYDSCNINFIGIIPKRKNKGIWKLRLTSKGLKWVISDFSFHTPRIETASPQDSSLAQLKPSQETSPEIDSLQAIEGSLLTRIDSLESEIRNSHFSRTQDCNYLSIYLKSCNAFSGALTNFTSTTGKKSRKLKTGLVYLEEALKEYLRESKPNLFRKKVSVVKDKSYLNGQDCISNAFAIEKVREFCIKLSGETDSLNQNKRCNQDIRNYQECITNFKNQTKNLLLQLTEFDLSAARYRKLGKRCESILDSLNFPHTIVESPSFFIGGSTTVPGLPITTREIFSYITNHVPKDENLYRGWNANSINLTFQGFLKPSEIKKPNFYYKVSSGLDFQTHIISDAVFDSPDWVTNSSLLERKTNFALGAKFGVMPLQLMNEIIWFHFAIGGSASFLLSDRGTYERSYPFNPKENIYLGNYNLKPLRVTTNYAITGEFGVTIKLKRGLIRVSLVPNLELRSPISKPNIDPRVMYDFAFADNDYWVNTLSLSTEILLGVGKGKNENKASKDLKKTSLARREQGEVGYLNE